MKQHVCITQSRVLRKAVRRGSLAILTFSSRALAASATQSGEQKVRRRVGHTDLKGRLRPPAECHPVPGWKYLLPSRYFRITQFRYPGLVLRFCRTR